METADQELVDRFARMDAAEARIAFKTRPSEDQKTVQVTFFLEQSDTPELTYRIHLERDVVDTIAFAAAGPDGKKPLGQITFNYFDELPKDEAGFPEPKISADGSWRKSPGMAWLMDLAR